MSIDNDPTLAMWRRRRARDSFVSEHREVSSVPAELIEDISNLASGVAMLLDRQNKIEASVSELRSIIADIGSIKRSA